MIYTYRCAKLRTCSHEWETTDAPESFCDWCGAPGFILDGRPVPDYFALARKALRALEEPCDTH